jgi:hypothetical protein
VCVAWQAPNAKIAAKRTAKTPDFRRTNRMAKSPLQKAAEAADIYA